MSTQSAQQFDFAYEVRGLKRKVAKLLKRLEQPVDGADSTLNEWRAKHKISKAGYYKMAKAGRGPSTIKCNGIIRVTPEADRAWIARFTPAERATFAADSPEEPN